MSQWEEIQKVVNYPGAVKCHWFTRHLRDPALLELVILVTKLHYLCIDLPFSMNATMASAGKRDVSDSWLYPSMPTVMERPTSRGRGKA